MGARRLGLLCRPLSRSLCVSTGRLSAQARVVELVDTADLRPADLSRRSSSLLSGTKGCVKIKECGFGLFGHSLLGKA